MQFLFLLCRSYRAKKAHRNLVGALASLLPTPSQKFFRPFHTLVSLHTMLCCLTTCFFSVCWPRYDAAWCKPRHECCICTLRNAAFLHMQHRYGCKACYFHFAHEFSCVRTHASVPFVVCSYGPLNPFRRAKLVLDKLYPNRFQWVWLVCFRYYLPVSISHETRSFPS